MKSYKVCKQLICEIFNVYITLLKLMIPAVIIVKVLEELGGIALIGKWLSPFMLLVGLPQELGVVWATAIFTNVYTSMVVFVDISSAMTLSVANVSVVGILILLSHSIPIEGGVAKMVGVSWRVVIALRVGGGLVLAAITNWIYKIFDYQQQDAVMLWQVEQNELTLIGWFFDQLEMFVYIFFIISGLIILLRIMKWVGVETMIQAILQPVLNIIGITKNASNITIVGITLGLSFGAGLLISEVKQGKISKRDVLLSISFLSLAHSLIEDTLLILLLGSDLTAILGFRLVFAVFVVFMMSRFISEKRQSNYVS